MECKERVRQRLNSNFENWPTGVVWLVWDYFWPMYSGDKIDLVHDMWRLWRPDTHDGKSDLRKADLKTSRPLDWVGGGRNEDRMAGLLSPEVKQLIGAASGKVLHGYYHDKDDVSEDDSESKFTTMEQLQVAMDKEDLNEKLHRLFSTIFDLPIICSRTITILEPPVAAYARQGVLNIHDQARSLYSTGYGGPPFDLIHCSHDRDSDDPFKATIDTLVGKMTRRNDDGSVDAPFESDQDKYADLCDQQRQWILENDPSIVKSLQRSQTFECGSAQPHLSALGLLTVLHRFLRVDQVGYPLSVGGLDLHDGHAVLRGALALDPRRV